MDKELIKALIEEIGVVALEAVAGKKFATLGIKFALSIMTKDFVLDKIIGLFGSNPATFLAGVKARVAARPQFVTAAPESTIDEACTAFDASLTA